MNNIIIIKSGYDKSKEKIIGLIPGKLIFCVLGILISFGGCFNDTTTKEILEGKFVSLPVIKSVLVKSSKTLEVIYDRSMEPSGIGDAANYTIEERSGGSLAVSAVSLVPGLENTSVSVNTGIQEGREYTITVKNVSSANGKEVHPDGTAFTFTGFNTDRSAPLILAPSDGEQVPNLSSTIIWSSNSEASFYTVEVATDSGFNSQVTGSPFTVDAPESILALDSSSLVSAVSYYVRVRSDITTTGSYSNIVLFEALSDTIYVSCPAGAVCDDTGKAGTLTNPYQTINKGILAAEKLGIGTIVVAGRGNSGSGNDTYPEMVNVLPGTGIFGGYSPDFSQRDTAVYTTIISNTGTFTVAVTGAKVSTGSVVLDGITIRGGTNGITYALYVSDSDSSLTVRDSIISGGDASGSSYGVYNIVSGTTSGTGPLYLNNQISGGNAALSSYGMYNRISSPSVNGNSITAGNSTGENVGMYVYHGNPLVENNTAVSGGTSSTGKSYGICIDNESTNSLILNSNTVSGGTSTADSSYGIYASLGSAVFSGNTISGGSAPAIGKTSYGVYGTGIDLTFTGDTITTSGASANSTAFNTYDGKLSLAGGTVSTGDGVTGTSYGFNIEGTQIRLLGNNVTLGTSGYNCGLNSYSGTNDASGLLSGNTFTIGSAGEVYGMYIIYSGYAIIGNTIKTGASTGGGSDNIALRNDTTSGSAVIWNTIIGNDSLQYSMGVMDRLGGTYYGNTIVTGSSVSANTRSVAYEIWGGSKQQYLYNNILFTRGGTLRYGIYELGSAGYDVEILVDNMIFETPDALYYDADLANKNLNDGNTSTAAIDWHDGTGTVIPFIGSRTTADGYANNGYDGTTSSFEMYSGSYCDTFFTGAPIVYDYGGGSPSNHTVTAVDCSVYGNPIIYFTPALGSATTVGITVAASMLDPGNETLTVSQTINDVFADTSESAPDYALPSTSPAINRVICPTGNDAAVQSWGYIYTGPVDQTYCDQNFPGSDYNNLAGTGEWCEATYLENTIEVLNDSVGNDNGLCESGETCIFNPNRGAYPGHGNLVSASTAVTNTPSCSNIGTGGTIENVTLLKYDTNGY